MFLAALLEPPAQRLHALFPRGSGQETEFPGSWITPANRAAVRDFGRSQTGDRSGSGRLDDEIVRMSGPYAVTARKTLALASNSMIRHADVHAAMLAAASEIERPPAPCT